MAIHPITLLAGAGLLALRESERAPDQSEATPANEFAGWYWPIATLNIGGTIYLPTISDTYSATETSKHREHHGVDIDYRRKSGGGPDQKYPRNSSEGSPNYFCPTGTEALCPRDGKIWSSGQGGKGDWVVIDCGKPIAIFITHMRSLRVPYGISNGSGGHVVKAGDVIGTVSFSPEDKAKFNHVHMEIWRNGPSSAHVDPMPYLTKAGYF